MMRHRLKAAISAVTLVVGLLTVGFVTGAGPAQAVSACSGAQSNFFGGWDANNASGTSQPQSYGVAANIVYYQGTVCTGVSAGNFSASWSMIASPNGGGGWAQSGQIYAPNQPCMQHFAQDNQTSSTTPDTHIYGSRPGDGGNHCAANGQVHQAWTTLAPSGVFNMNIDTTNLLNSYFAPLTASGWAGLRWQMQLNGEVTYKQSDIPGDAALPTDWSDVQGEYNTTGSFENICTEGITFSSFASTSRFATQAITCSEARAWTAIP
jgi:hypothetical protein